MTGMLLDTPAVVLVAVGLAASVCRAWAYADNWVSVSDVWQPCLHMLLIWWGLVLLSFVPTMFHIDTSEWQWPLNQHKRPLSHQGGPPTNKWPDEKRKRYFHKSAYFRRMHAPRNERAGERGVDGISQCQ